MKKWLSLILVLCMMLPLAAFGEAADKAQLVEITFTPGTLPEGAEDAQSVFEQAMKTLGINIFSQEEDEYGKVDLLLNGESVLSFATLMKDGNFNLVSELFGAKPLAFTEAELTALLEEAMSTDGTPMSAAMKDQMLASIKVMFGGTVEGTDFEDEMEAMMEQMLPALMQLMDTLSAYAEKAETVQGDFVVTDTIKGTQAAAIRLNHDDLCDIVTKIGESMGTVDFFKKQIEAQADGQTYEDIFAEAVKEIPESAQAEINVIMDANEEVLAVNLLMKDDDSDVAVVVIPDMDNEQFVIQMIMDGDEKVEMTFKVSDDTVNIRIESLMLDSDSVWESEGSFGMDITVKEEADTTEVVFAFNYEDKMIFALNIKVSEVDKVALPDVQGAVHPTAISEDELNTLMQEYLQNGMMLLQTAFTKLPSELQDLLGNMM